LKRAIERLLVYPLANLVESGQVEQGDLLLADVSGEAGRLSFTKRRGGALYFDGCGLAAVAAGVM
jgi:hypothetical protein